MKMQVLGGETKMIHWMHMLIAEHGGNDRRDRPVLTLVGAADGSCPVCDHPFANLSHACIA